MFKGEGGTGDANLDESLLGFESIQIMMDY